MFTDNSPGTARSTHSINVCQMSEQRRRTNTGDLPRRRTLQMHTGEKREAEVQNVFKGKKGKLGELLLESLFCQ